MLAECDGKFDSSLLRRDVQKAVSHMVPDSQVGSGLHGGATDVGHLMTRAIFSLAGAALGSVAILYLDVVRAFASMRRRIALPGDIEGEEHWLRWLLQCGFSADDANDIILAACSFISWADAGAHPHAVAMLQAAHTRSWFSIEGLAQVYRYSKCAAGTPLSDLVYAIDMMFILKEPERMIDAADLSSTASCQGCSQYFADAEDPADVPAETFRIRGPAYVDDVAILRVTQAISIVGDMTIISKLAVQVFSAFRLALNFAKGKSHVLIRFAGKGAGGARRAFAAAGERLKFEVDGAQYVVHAVNMYKHLGTATTATLSLGLDLSMRFGSMRSALRPIASRFFRNPRIALEKKTMVCRSLLLSKGLFNASTWQIPTAGEKRRIHTNVMYVYRSTAAAHYKEVAHASSDQEILGRLQVLAPYTLIRLARLCLATRIFTKSPLLLKRLLFASRFNSKAWLRAFHDDLERLSRVSGFPWTMQVFIEHARQSRKSLRNAIKKTCSLPTANVLGLDAMVMEVLDSDDEPLINLLHGAVGVMDFRYNDCGKTFVSHQKRSVHKANRFTTCTNPLPALRKKLVSVENALLVRYGLTIVVDFWNTYPRKAQCAELTSCSWRMYRLTCGIHLKKRLEHWVSTTLSVVCDVLELMHLHSEFRGQVRTSDWTISSVILLGVIEATWRSFFLWMTLSNSIFAAGLPH